MLYHLHVNLILDHLQANKIFNKTSMNIIAFKYNEVKKKSCHDILQK